MKSELVPSNGDPPIPIVKDVTVLGRDAGCDVRLAQPGLSKRHCVLVRTDGLLVLRDLASTNGTKVNNQRVRWAALLPNDKVSFAGYKCRVYLGADDAPSPSERAGRVPAAAAATPAASPPAPAAEFPPPSIPDVISLGDDDLVDLDFGDDAPAAGPGRFTFDELGSDDDRVILLD